MRWLRRLWPGWRRDPRHVRVHMLHEGTDQGDMTLEGFQTSESRDWIVLDRAVILTGEGRRTRLEGAVSIPRARLLIREELVAVALPEIPDFVESR